MKKLLLLAVMAVFAVSCITEDENPPETLEECTFTGDVLLTSQAEVDAFAAHNYCMVDGNVRIGSMLLGPTDITSLEGFGFIVRITGSLEIVSNPELESLHGLHNLQEIKGNLSIISNAGLTTMEGLNSLAVIGTSDMPGNSGALDIQHNNALTSLEGLDALMEINSLDVQFNTALASFNGFQTLQKINTNLIVVENGSLVSLNGLSNLESASSVFLSENDLLASIEALAGLEELTQFTALGNIALSNFCPVSAVAGTALLQIQDNAYNPTHEDFAAGNCSQ